MHLNQHKKLKLHTHTHTQLDRLMVVAEIVCAPDSANMYYILTVILCLQHYRGEHRLAQPDVSTVRTYPCCPLV